MFNIVKFATLAMMASAKDRHLRYHNRTGHTDAQMHQSPIDLSRSDLNGTVSSDDSFGYHYGNVSKKDLGTYGVGKGLQFTFE